MQPREPRPQRPEAPDVDDLIFDDIPYESER